MWLTHYPQPFCISSVLKCLGFFFSSHRWCCLPQKRVQALFICDLPFHFRTSRQTCAYCRQRLARCLYAKREVGEWWGKMGWESFQDPGAVKETEKLKDEHQMKHLRWMKGRVMTRNFRQCLNSQWEPVKEILEVSCVWYPCDECEGCLPKIYLSLVWTLGSDDYFTEDFSDETSFQIYCKRHQTSQCKYIRVVKNKNLFRT